MSLSSVTKGRTLPFHAQASDHTTTRALTEAIVRGDASALDALYRAWFDRMVGLAASATGRDEAFCLDAVQEAFLRVIRAPRVIETEPELAAWLRRCVLSAAVDRLRREARASLRERRASSHGSQGESSDQSTQASEQLAWLAARLRECGDADRELFQLRFVAERTLEEIALARGTTKGQAHGRIRRLIAALRTVAGGIAP